MDSIDVRQNYPALALFKKVLHNPTYPATRFARPGVTSRVQLSPFARPEIGPENPGHNPWN